MYTSKFADEALQDIRKLPKNVRNSLKREFQRKVHVNPVDCSEPLEGLLEKFRSFHYGDYRIIYQVFQDIKAIAVVGIGKKDKNHRAEIYRHLENLARRGRLAATVLETYRAITEKPPST